MSMSATGWTPFAHRARQSKFEALLSYFTGRLLTIGLDPFTVEGCEFALRLIELAGDRDWERIGRDAGLKSRPKTTVDLLRVEFQARLRAARIGRK